MREAMRRGASFGVMLGSAMAAQACIGGVVRDASTGAALEGVVVTAIGQCLGAGCEDGLYQEQTTDAQGAFVFDAYGDVHGEDEVQIIHALPGNESAVLVVAKSGYQPRIVYVKPEYTAGSEYGEDRLGRRINDVYLCPVGAPDDDDDSLCNAAEAHYGTDPNNADTDGDSLQDAVELFGINDVDLAHYGANPLRRDVFVEIDYFAEVWSPVYNDYVSHQPVQADLDRVVEAFANAPVANPDGSAGVSLHFVVDDAIPLQDSISVMDPELNDLKAIKSKYFDARRARIFRYGLFACHENNIFIAGRAEWPGANFVLYLQGAGVSRAPALMHELGHNLGLGHGGQDAENDKPHYFSIMNYTYGRGVRVDGQGVLDYSRLEVAGISESSLSEPQAFTPVGSTTEADLARYSVARACGSGWFAGNASANLDFDDDGVIDPASVSVDLNCNDSWDSWGASQNDWDVLNYSGGGLIGQVSNVALAGAPGESELVGCDLP